MWLDSRFFGHVSLPRSRLTATSTRMPPSQFQSYAARPPALLSRRRLLRQPDLFRRFNSSNSAKNQTSSSAGQEQHMSLSQRFGKLSREYGWSALGVYLLLSALDFPFCFAALRLFGVDRIAHVEHVVVGSIKGALAYVLGSRQQPSPNSADSSPNLDRAIEQENDDTEPSTYIPHRSHASVADLAWLQVYGLNSLSHMLFTKASSSSESP